ncbi:two-component system, chemotaxis family, response regulator CheB [Noviherbaspirillum humi]|uniref:protein-glutamate methylesterase n=2 Tax=Noviherbaspirillum humi TaxID=1688639 RepID=A0A239C4L4_9BURK|nr:two-component system, chemotaxis family, response regulator CheB [Noviherbaspirillum humi]
MARDFDAVVIGASAGGVDALTQLAHALPARFGKPVMVVMHLPPGRDSLLPALMARRCPLRVKEAEDKEPLQPDTVYLAVPDYHLLVEPDRRLALSRDEPVQYSRPSIDLLFESAALAYGERLLAIVLTGANNDGSAGLQTVRRFGGTAWVQDPRQAQASLMPASAIAEAGADAVLTLEQIAEGLGGHAHPQKKGRGTT